MEMNEYQKLAMTTLNKELNKKDILINGVMGLCGESGEVIDIVKKHLSQGHPLDKEHILDELGDVAWYLAETAYALDTDLNTVLENNKHIIKVANSVNNYDEKTIPSLTKAKFSTKGKGRGFGLHNIKNIVEKYKGNLDIRLNDDMLEITISI